MRPRLDPWGRLRWRALRFADRHDRVIVTTVRRGPGQGIRIANKAASADYGRGINEMPVQQALAAELAAGDVFWDVGANVGFFALLAKRLVGELGQVTAIEPHPRVAAALRSNVELNGADIDVVEAAVSDKSGSGRLGVSTHPGGNSLERTGAPHDASGFVDVDVTTLDALLDERARPPSLVKIDTETGELEVILGAERLLRDHRPKLLLELDAATEEALQQKVRPIGKRLERSGYSVAPLAAAYPNRRWQVTHLLARPA